MLLIFALTATYSVICPLIAPFGLFYMIMKHLVDRYNIYYAYKVGITNGYFGLSRKTLIFCIIYIQTVLLGGTGLGNSLECFGFWMIIKHL